MRSVLVGLCAFLLRLFFRRIEVVGAHHVPQDGAVIFALNHPNGLLDPLFVLCFSGRRVSFLAKEPLFHMPVVGFFVRQFESLPVYRSRDGADPKKNQAMMDAAQALLARGNAIALFPEGTSHSDPSLKPFKTGAARMALGARASADMPVYLVPGALFFDAKQSFRSRAVVAFGTPISVPRVELNERGAPPPEHAHALTKELQRGIQSIMPTADTVDYLTLAESAERVFSAALRDTPAQCPMALELDASFAGQRGSHPELSKQPSLGQRMTRRRKLIDGYLGLVDHRGQDVQRLLERIQELRDRLSLASLPIDAAHDHAFHSGRRFARSVVTLALLTPCAAMGLLLHAPAYHLVRFIAFRYSGAETDVLATVKLLAGLLLFPLTWLVLSLGVASQFGWQLALLTLSACPVLAWLTVIFQDHLGYALHHGSLRRRVAHASIDWPEIVAQRAQLAEHMAQLLQTDSAAAGATAATLEPGPA